MSVLINGMDMPESCGQCRVSFAIDSEAWLCQLCLDPNTDVDDAEFLRDCGEGADKKHPEWCPLAGVPTPHGRLIDADALVAEFQRLSLGENSMIERFFADGVYAVLAAAPTIIEAEGKPNADQ